MRRTEYRPGKVTLVRVQGLPTEGYGSLPAACCKWSTQLTWPGILWRLRCTLTRSSRIERATHHRKGLGYLPELAILRLTTRHSASLCRKRFSFATCLKATMELGRNLERGA